MKKDNEFHVYEGKEFLPPDLAFVKVDVECIPPLAFLLCKTTLTQVELVQKVSAISERAFYQCVLLEEVELKEVTVIGDAAFYQCSKLARVYLSHALKIGKGAFFQCISLERIRIPYTTVTIAESAFCGCHTLVEVTLVNDSNLQEIGPMAFCECIALKRIKIPNTVKRLGLGTFRGCTALRHVEFSTQMIEIGNSCFRNCTSLQRMRMPMTLLHLGRHAFSGCFQLLSVELPETLQTLGDYAFSSCENLINIALGGEDLEFCGRVVFGGCFPDYRDVANTLKTRFDGFPIHKVCYYHTFYQTFGIDQLQQAMEQDSSPKLVDSLGFTPFHLLALSTKPNFEFWVTLLQRFNSWHKYKDSFGKTPLDYLYMSDDSKATELIKCVVRSPKVWSNGRSNY